MSREHIYICSLCASYSSYVLRTDNMLLETACTVLSAWHVAVFELRLCSCASLKRSKTTCCTTPRLQVGAQGNEPTRSSPSRCVVGDSIIITYSRLCVYIEQSTTCRRRDSSASIIFVLLTIVAYGTGHDLRSCGNCTTTRIQLAGRAVPRKHTHAEERPTQKNGA